MKEDKTDFLILLIGLIVLAGIAFTVPLNPNYNDVYFDITVKNDIWNNPQIESVDVHVEKATLLESSLQMGGLFDFWNENLVSGDIKLVTECGDKSLTSNLGTMYILDSKTKHFKLSHVDKDVSTYVIHLYDDGKYVDIKSGNF